jgi:hypothetical protein
MEQWNYILVCGEDELKKGTVTIRSREGQIIGAKRVDEAHAFFQTLMPKKSSQEDEKYKNVWKPEDFPLVDETVAEVKHEEKKEEPSPAE